LLPGLSVQSALAQKARDVHLNVLWQAAICFPQLRQKSPSDFDVVHGTHHPFWADQHSQALFKYVSEHDPQVPGPNSTPYRRVLLDALDEGTAKASPNYRSARLQKLVNSEQ
jgi:hypothetical protein